VGLCPLHTHEFYAPLDPGDSTICPEPGCQLRMAVYEPAKLREAVDQIGLDIRNEDFGV
jgi:hypothetical protein